VSKKEGKGATKTEMGLSLRGKVPMAADRAKIGVPLTLNPDDQSGVKCVGL